MESLAKILLAVFLILFFVLMCVFLLIAILQGVFYIIYQRTDRIHLSRMTYCYAKNSYFVLENKKRKIDIIFLFSKRRNVYYLLGLTGVYKVKGALVQKISKEDLSTTEKTLIEDMKAECIKKVQEDITILTSFLQGQGESSP